MVDNLVYEIAYYGRILNANRTYYLTRSQPPFLTSMALAVYEALPRTDASKRWLKRVLLAAIDEYHHVWMDRHHRTAVGLNRYYGTGIGVPPEVEPGISSIPDVTLGDGVPDLVSGRRPVPPPLARLHGARGGVEVRFSLDAAGRTTVHGSEGPALLAPQALHAVESWVFRRRVPERLFLQAVFSYEGHTASAHVTLQGSGL